MHTACVSSIISITPPPPPAGAHPEPHRVVARLRLPLQQHPEQRGPGGRPAPAPPRGPQAHLRGAPGRGAGARGGGPRQPLLHGEGQRLPVFYLLLCFIDIFILYFLPSSFLFALF